jgi:phosphatidylethanolamine/phosphatidyl-N-methylethanolamine N-methyltransferase
LLNFVHFIKHLKHTGAVAPSSRWLAVELVQAIRRQRLVTNRPLRILELGPGTGAITAAITDVMRKEDRLDIVEIDLSFYRHICKLYQGRCGVSVYGMDVLEFTADKPYDVILSSIPYEQIPESITDKIWARKLELARPGTSISYYKYYRFNHFSSDFEKSINRRYCTQEKLILRNVPPAIAYHLTIPEAGSIF